MYKISENFQLPKQQSTCLATLKHKKKKKTSKKPKDEIKSKPKGNLT